MAMTHAPDNELKELEDRLRSGDRQALAELFEKFRERLWRIVNFADESKSPAPAWNRTIFSRKRTLAASKRLEHFVRGSFESSFLWLRLIVNQCLIEAYRRHLGAKGRDARMETPIQGALYPQATSVSLAIQLVAQTTSPSQKVIRQDLVQQVEQAHKPHGGPLTRKYWPCAISRELTNNEAARVLNIEPKAASIRYVRAVKRLKDVLALVPGLLEVMT